MSLLLAGAVFCVFLLALDLLTAPKVAEHPARPALKESRRAA